MELKEIQQELNTYQEIIIDPLGLPESKIEEILLQLTNISLQNNLSKDLKSQLYEMAERLSIKYGGYI